MTLKIILLTTIYFTALVWLIVCWDDIEPGST